jgi:hypothetical protein
MRRDVMNLSLVATLAVLAGCQENRKSAVARKHPPHPTTRQTNFTEDEQLDDSEATLFRRLDEAFARKGDVQGGVYRLVTPRHDLLVTMDGMDVPPGAFLESDFRFWRCPCGKLLVNGQFVVADYEANDVINELQLGHLEIAGVGPLLLHENPRLMLIRFQGEGRAKGLAEALKSALSYTAEMRSFGRRIDLAPKE